jgi:hypothetical protein
VTFVLTKIILNYLLFLAERKPTRIPQSIENGRKRATTVVNQRWIRPFNVASREEAANFIEVSCASPELDAGNGGPGAKRGVIALAGDFPSYGTEVAMQCCVCHIVDNNNK